MIKETSINAYKDLKETTELVGRQRAVYEAFKRQNKPITARELFYLFSGKDLVFSNIRARISELRDMGVVKEVGRRICDITGRNVTEWALTGDKPTKTHRVSREDRKKMVLDYIAVMFQQTKEPKQREDLKILYRMLKEL